MTSLREGPAYVQYQYGYPHKTAYRTLSAPVPLAEAWADEARTSRSLYLHVPFCEMRCGFCNLFTVAGPVEPSMVRFVETLEREATVVRGAVGPATYARAALGGGTPSLLPLPLLERVLRVASTTMGAALGSIPFSVELSPETTTRECVALLRQFGANRLSLGVQSFLLEETQALARPQERAVVERALDVLRSSGTDTLNVDLIYGIEGQTAETFLESIDAALRFTPEELYLYPLYVRPKTFLGKSPRAWDDFRLELYRVGREALLAKGYRQQSMRCFRLASAPVSPPFRCQDDALVGLGVGARSYTQALHYASEWAVSPREVRGLIDQYCAREDSAFAFAHHGIALDGAEQRRRHLILSLLADGLSRADYVAKFGSDPADEFPELATLVAQGLAHDDGARWVLSDDGVARSDAIGPWLQSAPVTSRMAEYRVR